MPRNSDFLNNHDINSDHKVGSNSKSQETIVGPVFMPGERLQNREEISQQQKSTNQTEFRESRSDNNSAKSVSSVVNKMAFAMPITPLCLDNIQCNIADRPSKYVPHFPNRKQSVFVAPSGLSSIVRSSPPPPPPLRTISPPKKSSLPKANAQILEQHISKLISENEAIVETLDPLWSKRYISRNSTSCLPNMPTNGLLLPNNQNNNENIRRFSEANCNQPLSKLQSALLGKSSTNSTSPPIRKYSEYSSESSQQSVIINAKDNNNNNNNNNSNNSNNSNNDGERVDSIVRNLLTTKTPAIQVTPSEKTSPVVSMGAHPQNPEGSIIKDLLLKSREDGRKKSRTEIKTSCSEQESSMLVYVCTVCNIAFRNKENLEAHQIHYCKGNDELLSPNRPSKHNMEDLVQRKVSVMARPNIMQKHYQQQTISQALQSREPTSHSTPTPPVGNILKQQLLAPNQGPPLKKRKISEPVFRSNSSSADVQIIDETAVRRISVVQQTTTNTSTITTTKSTALQSSPIGSSTSVSSSHTVIQPVLHSGATVIENYQSHKKCIPYIDNYNRTGSSQMTPSVQAKPQPVNKCGSNLVRQSIEILPAYLPHLNKPNTKISFKGPISFPVLKNLYSNGTNLEFTVDDVGSFKPNETPTERNRSNPFKQVASLPQDNTHLDENNDNTDDEDIQIIDKDKDKEETAVSTAANGLVVPKTTAAVRPRTLALRTNASCLISSTLISPDTPRPDKTCVQLYINGHAYTNIALKVTTRPTFCCIYRAQPMFITQEANPGLSMYSNYETIPLPADDIFNLATPRVVMGLYDSRNKHRSDSMLIVSAGKSDLNSTHSSYWQFRKSDEEKDSLNDIIAKLRQEIGEDEEVYRKISEEVSASSAYSGDTDSDGGDVGPPKRVRIFEGGFKSNEDYTYVRGRGRGKYVCEECGIRCKKPSMLKKHIRTHTDLRPYSCRHCAFAFKTKGNLTKHMKSKAHHKKCVEMGIIPVPITIDESQIDSDALAKQEMLEISCGNLPEDEDEDDDEGEYDEDEDEDDDEGVPIPLIELQRFESMSKSSSIVPGQFEDADMAEERNRVISETESAATETEEQEAARSLLILSGSGSESDLTALSTLSANSRKTSTITNEDIRNSPTETRKVSVIDRRVSQQVLEEQRRISQVIDAENHRRISQQVLENEQQRRVSQQVDQTIKSTEMPELVVSSAVMQPPIEPPPPLMPSPRKLSPIEQLQQQVQQQQHLMQTTWTPNCDSMSRQRSYSFNDVPLNANVFPSTSRPPIEPIEPISDESSGDSLDSFAARRYSTSVIAERRWNSQTKPPKNLGSIPEREEPMDLSLSAKANEILDGIILPQMSQSKSIPITLSSGLRQGEFIPTAPQRNQSESLDGKSICSICNKQFSKPSQLRLHINIHYFERPFRCDSCAVSFRTKGHLQKHKRSVSHFNKVNMNMTFGTPTTDNPRPFKCADCKIAFRIHGHLAKHLRSKMHIMKLECLGKLPFGMYAEMERSGVNLNEIDTTDCENSLQSLQMMAQRLYDPRQMRWASEPITDNNNSPYDDESIVKNEPQDSYYALEHEPQPMIIRSPPQQQLVISSQPRLSPVPPLPPSSPPQSAKSPPFQSPPVVVQQQSGFTSTRSNTCHLCGRLFKGAKFLQVHLYCDHQQESPSPQLDERPEYECDICHKGFNEIPLLQQHLLTHSAPRPYVCDICDAGFTSSILLASHIPTHHPLATQ